MLSNGEEVVHGLTQEHLKVFVNSAEWTLGEHSNKSHFPNGHADFTSTASSVSNDPVLHFVLFVPSDSHSPLHILDEDSESGCFFNLVAISCG